MRHWRVWLCGALTCGVIGLAGWLWAATMSGPAGTPVLLTETNGLTIATMGTSYLRLQQLSADPAVPPSGFWVLYPKANGVHARDSAGNVVGPFGTGGSPGPSVASSLM